MLAILILKIRELNVYVFENSRFLAIFANEMFKGVFEFNTIKNLSSCSKYNDICLF